MAGKITLLGRVDESGWSESYYFTSDVISELQSTGMDLARTRMRLCGPQAVIHAMRLSSTDPGKPSKIVRVSVKGNAKDANATLLNSDQPSAGAFTNVRAITGQRRQLMIVPIIDSWIVSTSTTEAVVNGAGQVALNAFFASTFLVDPVALIRTRDYTGKGVPISVTAVAQDVSGRYLLTTGVAHGYAVGTRVSVKGFKGFNLAGLKGIVKVASVVDPNNFLVNRGPRADLGKPIYDGTGFVSAVQYTYQQSQQTVDSWQPTTRRRGRPFSPRRGRRTAKR